jgi:2,3-dihydroxyphenylpropionate 1,2-dioxygenase
MTRPDRQIAVLVLSHSPQMAQDTERKQGLEFRAGLKQVVTAVGEFAPDLVVFFGPDHMRSLAGIAPCFTVVESATGYGDWGTPTGNYAVDTDLAIKLGRHLAASGVDIACAPELSLDHGIGQSFADIFGSLSAVPILPIVINCVDRPLATLARTAELGRNVGAFLRSDETLGQRVLVIGSGGISHSPPSLIPGARDLSEQERQALITDQLETAARAINPDWDRRFLGRLSGRQWQELGELTPEDLAPAGTGGEEVRTWVAAVFAGGEPLSTVVYEPVSEWITGMGIAVSALLTRTTESEESQQ